MARVQIRIKRALPITLAAAANGQVGIDVIANVGRVHRARCPGGEFWFTVDYSITYKSTLSHSMMGVVTFMAILG